MRKLLPFLFLALIACYDRPQVEGFNRKHWQESRLTCDENRLEMAQTLIAQQHKIAGSTQNEVKKLLGAPDEHELYERNQKFFYYDLTTGACDTLAYPQRLSIRFDALGRVKDLMIIDRI